MPVKYLFILFLVLSCFFFFVVAVVVIVLSWFNRIWPAVLRQATYGTIKFGTYYTLKKIVTEKGWLIDKHGNERVWCNVLCAVIAGAISSAIATPTDVLKVRMQVHGRGTDKVGLIGCFREIYHQEGISGLWRVCTNDFYLFH